MSGGNHPHGDCRDCAAQRAEIKRMCEERDSAQRCIEKLTTERDEAVRGRLDAERAREIVWTMRSGHQCADIRCGACAEFIASALSAARAEGRADAWTTYGPDHPFRYSRLCAYPATACNSLLMHSAPCPLHEIASAIRRGE